MAAVEDWLQTWWDGLEAGHVRPVPVELRSQLRRWQRRARRIRALSQAAEQAVLRIRIVLQGLLLDGWQTLATPATERGERVATLSPAAYDDLLNRHRAAFLTRHVPLREVLFRRTRTLLPADLQHGVDEDLADLYPEVYATAAAEVFALAAAGQLKLVKDINHLLQGAELMERREFIDSRFDMSEEAFLRHLYCTGQELVNSGLPEWEREAQHPETIDLRLLDDNLSGLGVLDGHDVYQVDSAWEARHERHRASQRQDLGARLRAGHRRVRRHRRTCLALEQVAQRLSADLPIYTMERFRLARQELAKALSDYAHGWVRMAEQTASDMQPPPLQAPSPAAVRRAVRRLRRPLPP